MNALFEPLTHGISVVDTGFVRPQFDASFLIVEQGRAAFVDTGPNSAVPRLLAALEAHGLQPDAVDYVVPTHVHLDHAGGAGLLMQHCPSAKMIIHPRGARHMADPTALMEGVRGVYGAEVAARDYGELVPVPTERMMETHDGMVLEFAGRRLKFIDTPGHARHHHCIWDEASRGWFAGDTFGIAYPQLHTPKGPYLLPTTTPVQFDQQALHASVARLLAEKPAFMYLTHYGAVKEPEKLSGQLLSQLDAMVEAALALKDAANRHQQLKRAFADIYLRELRRCGSTQSDASLVAVLANDIELNAQGLGIWLDRN
jgi:glyoxylase-like metal-dependent hydrolase (beta-lactamase superfamily II)